MSEERKYYEATADGTAAKLLEELASFPPDLVANMFERGYSKPVTRFDLQMISYRITDIFTPLFTAIIALGGDRPEIAQELARSAASMKRFQDDMGEMILGTLTDRAREQLIAHSVEKHQDEGA